MLNPRAWPAGLNRAFRSQSCFVLYYISCSAFPIALDGTEPKKLCLIKVCGGSLGLIYEKFESYFLELSLLPLLDDRMQWRIQGLEYDLFRSQPQNVY